MTNKMKNVPELRFPEFIEEWEEKRLGDLYKYQQGQQIPVENQYKIQINNMKRFIRIVDVTENPKKRYIKDRKESGLINQKDLIMIRYGASAGTISMGYEGVIANNLFKFVKKQNVDNRYFYFLLKKSHFKIKSLSSQSAMPALNFNAMDTLKFSIPQYSEQQKIGSFFSKLDRQIELEEQKLAKLEEQKKGYMQKLFSQEIRFKDNKGNNYPDWKIVEIGDILEERTERSGEGYMLSVTINNGIIKFDEIDRKDNSSKDKSNYRKVYKDDIAYNSMRMWQGASGKSEYEGIVSPAYTVTIPSENINPDFIAYYFKTHKMIHKFKINSQGLTSDTWNLKYRQLKDIKLNLCSKEEQNKIANLLIMYDKLINKQKHKLEILKTNKKGFLQKMFI